MYLIHSNQYLNKIEPFSLQSLSHSQQDMSYSNDSNVWVQVICLAYIYLITLNHYSSTVSIHMHNKLRVIRMIHTRKLAILQV